MIKISCTTLDFYRQYLVGKIKLEVLISKLKKEFKPSPAMNFGTQVHAILQYPEKYLVVGGSEDGGQRMEYGEYYKTNLYNLHKDEIDEVIASLPKGEFEKNGEKEYLGMKLTGRSDLVTPNKIIDFKVTFKPIFMAMNDYEGSWQPKIYMNLFEKESFEYMFLQFNNKGRLVSRETLSISAYQYDKYEFIKFIPQIIKVIETNNLIHLYDKEK